MTRSIVSQVRRGAVSQIKAKSTCWREGAEKSERWAALTCFVLKVVRVLLDHFVQVLLQEFLGQLRVLLLLGGVARVDFLASLLRVEIADFRTCVLDVRNRIRLRHSDLLVIRVVLLLHSSRLGLLLLRGSGRLLSTSFSFLLPGLVAAVIQHPVQIILASNLAILVFVLCTRMGLVLCGLACVCLDERGVLALK